MRRLPSNWRSRIEIVEDEEAVRCTFTLQFRKGYTPKGFFRYIGTCLVDDELDISELDIQPRFQRRGLGTMLLKTALNRFGTLEIYWRTSSDLGKQFYKWFAENVASGYKTDFWNETLILKK